jgi:hypothetical protein
MMGRFIKSSLLNTRILNEENDRRKTSASSA